jgi:hypothetical protein
VIGVGARRALLVKKILFIADYSQEIIKNQQRL